jgi:hypothetical protein
MPDKAIERERARMTKEILTAQDSAPNQVSGFDQALGVLRQFRGARRLVAHGGAL